MIFVSILRLAMAFRSLTEVFILMRNNAMQNRHIFAEPVRICGVYRMVCLITCCNPAANYSAAVTPLITRRLTVYTQCDAGTDERRAGLSFHLSRRRNTVPASRHILVNPEMTTSSCELEHCMGAKITSQDCPAPLLWPCPAPVAVTPTLARTCPDSVTYVLQSYTGSSLHIAQCPLTHCKNEKIVNDNPQ